MGFIDLPRDKYYLVYFISCIKIEIVRSVFVQVLLRYWKYTYKFKSKKAKMCSYKANFGPSSLYWRWGNDRQNL